MPRRNKANMPTNTPSGSLAASDFHTLVRTALPPPPVLRPAAPSLPAASCARAPAIGLPATMAALPNGGLMSNPTGNNALSGGTIPYNPNYYATLDAATRLAQQVGGSVVDRKAQFSNNQSEYYINLPTASRLTRGIWSRSAITPFTRGISALWTT